MKLNKTQLQQLIKEEVVKQKTIIELEDKKVRILRELEEMNYNLPENLEETSLFSPDEIATIEKESGQPTNADTQPQTIEEGKVGDFLKGLNVENLLDKLTGKAKEYLTQKGITTLPKELEKYAGKSFQEIKADVKNKLSTVALTEGIKDTEGIINKAGKFSEWLLGISVGSDLVLGMLYIIFDELDKFGWMHYVNEHMMYAVIPTIISIAIFLLTTILKASYKKK